MLKRLGRYAHSALRRCSRSGEIRHSPVEIGVARAINIVLLRDIYLIVLRASPRRRVPERPGSAAAGDSLSR